jgi:hypothetical protein
MCRQPDIHSMRIQRIGSRYPGHPIGRLNTFIVHTDTSCAYLQNPPNMTKEELPSYLKDHLAGSVGALELLDHLIETYKGEPLEEFFQNLRDEIDADQETLQDLIEELGEKESAVRKAGAWVAEKLSRAKIRLSASEKNQLGLLRALEGLVLGITGKRALWAALAVAADAVPQLRELDYARLQKRAAEQCYRVEVKRLEVAREVFSVD